MKPAHLSADYRPEIDGLRAFAVLSVVVYHAFAGRLSGGFVGVDIFFVISGFLITRHIFESLNAGGFSFTDFYGRRIRRLFPALLVVMFSSLLFGYFVLLADEFNQLGRHIAGASAFILNFILADEVGYFDTISETKPMLHLWSLAVEEQFYIIWPFLLWLVWRLKLSFLALTLGVISLSFYLNMSWIGTRPEEAFYWPFSRFWQLLSGSLLAWVFVYGAKIGPSFESKTSKVLVSLLVNLMSLAGLACLGLSVFFIDKTSSYPDIRALAPILGAMLIIASGPTALPNRLLLMNPIAVWFGLISYPLYLWHWPILSYLHIVENGAPSRVFRVLAVLVSIVLAWVTFRFFEKPIRFASGEKRWRTIILALCMGVIGILGLLLSSLDLSKSHNVQTVQLRDGLQHQIGASNRWYEGKNNWLFLGNAYDRTVEKLKLASQPPQVKIDSVKADFARLAEVAGESNTSIALLVGPNKSSIYPEYLPDRLSPSDSRYISFFLDALGDLQNLFVFDPTPSLLAAKRSGELLYYRSDTHWNTRGAYLSWTGMAQALGLTPPIVEFKSGDVHKGDLIAISGQKDFPLTTGDNWHPNYNQNPKLTREKFSPSLLNRFGTVEIITNQRPLSEQTIWLVGDSFVYGVKPFIEANFKKTIFLGHWNQGINALSEKLENADEKPDMIIIVRVERSF